MESLISVKKAIKAKDKELETLRMAHTLDPKVIATKKAYEEALLAAKEKVKEKIHAAYLEKAALHKKHDELIDQRAAEIPTDVQEFLRLLHAGCDWGPKGWVIKWISPKQNFVIATNPGHMYWSGGMQAYGESHHILFNITKLKDAKDHGIDVRNTCQIFTQDGRLTKETITQWKKHVAEKEG